MSYIGATPAESYASFYVQHFTTSATTSYALDYPVVNENDLRLVINNVVQQPGSGYAYTAAASTLTLSAATTTSDTMYAVFLGRALQTVNPPADSVGGSQLADTAISGQTALGAEPADTDEFLVSDAGTLKRMDYSYIKAGTADYVKIKSQTASTTTAIDFINGTSDVVLDSTYKIYKFFFYNMAPATDDTQFQIRTSTDLGVTWDELIGGNSYPAFEPPGSNTFTTTSWSNGSIVGAVGNAAAEDCNGEVTLFNPSGSVEFTKLSAYTISGRADGRTSVYINVFRAQAAEDVDAVRFEMGSGDMASGTIVLYGIK
jgi:hypothetical protein